MADKTTPTTATAHPTGNSGTDTNGAVEPLRVSDEVLKDWEWVFAGLNKGHFSQYRGQHIAVVDQHVVASDRDPLRLRETTAAAKGIEPDRIVVTYVDNWD
jgi:hypothetical protein